MDSKIQSLCETFDGIATDESTPRNVKCRAQEISSIISDINETIGNRKEKAMTILQNMVDDPNISVSTQMLLYNVISDLESLDM